MSVALVNGKRTARAVLFLLVLMVLGAGAYVRSMPLIIAMMPDRRGGGRAGHASTRPSSSGWF